MVGVAFLLPTLGFCLAFGEMLLYYSLDLIPLDFLIRCMAFAAMHIAEAERRLCSRPALQSLMQFGRGATRAVLLKTGLTGPRRG